MSRSHCVDEADALDEELELEQLGQTISDHCTSGAADSDTQV